MKLNHFDTLRPGCPVCHQQGAGYVRLQLGVAQTRIGDDVIEGILLCSNEDCQREYPIIDGIPILIADLCTYVTNQLPVILQRQDLSPLIFSMLGDAAGPGSAFDATRQHLSSYTWDHYADLDPAEPGGQVAPGGVVRALQEGLAAAGGLIAGPGIDVGCSVGRATFELARETDELVLGVDLNYAMLRTASRILRHGRVSYPRRDVGLVYQQREFDVGFPQADRVDFWACDVQNLPFASDTFAVATGWNVLDSVPDPRLMLSNLHRVLRPEGKSLLSCPYDWSPAATPVECWFGGHSQRTAAAGSSEQALNAWIQHVSDSTSTGWSTVACGEGTDWHVRLHNRSTMLYRNHRIVLEKVTQPARSNPAQGEAALTYA